MILIFNTQDNFITVFFKFCIVVSYSKNGLKQHKLQKENKFCLNMVIFTSRNVGYKSFSCFFRQLHPMLKRALLPVDVIVVVNFCITNLHLLRSKYFTIKFSLIFYVYFCWCIKLFYSCYEYFYKRKHKSRIKSHSF